MISTGEFITPLGTLHVKHGPIEDSETYVTFAFNDDEGRSVTFVFRSNEPDDWRFSHFEVELGTSMPDDPAPGSGTIMACEHITPDYQGTVYRVKSEDMPIETYVCPDCVSVEGVVLTGKPVNAIAGELWEDTKRNLHILDIELKVLL